MVTLISSLSLATQLLLMSKAVIVATTGAEVLYPSHKYCGYSGLVYMYAAIVAAMVASFVENAAAQRMVAGWKARLERVRAAAAAGSGDGAAEPLLGGKPVGQEGEVRHQEGWAGGVYCVVCVGMCAGSGLGLGVVRGKQHLGEGGNMGP